MDDRQPPLLPTHFELPNGLSVTIREIRSSDAALLVEMYHHLSERSKRLRFHTYTGNLPKERIWREAIALSDVDRDRQAALVAEYHEEGGDHIVGVARFARATADAVEAEAAIVVRDDFQRMGLGTHLLSLLLSLARSMGIKRVFGWVASENRHMLHIVKETDLPIHRETHSGETFVVLSLTL
jgi:acetyltransferase